VIFSNIDGFGETIPLGVDDCVSWGLAVSDIGVLLPLKWRTEMFKGAMGAASPLRGEFEVNNAVRLDGLSASMCVLLLERTTVLISRSIAAELPV
jgi:hypothetical protein